MEANKKAGEPRWPLRVRINPRLLALRVNHVRDALVALLEELHSTLAFGPLPKRNWPVIGQQRIAATLGS